MLKKILMGTAVLAASSFATYNYFPVPQAMSGEASLLADFSIQDKWKGLDLAVKGRFVPVQNLELFLKFPFAVVTRWDGNDVDKEGTKNLTFGGRYQVIPTVAVFLDITFPTGKDKINDDGFNFYFGGQFSQKLGTVDLGTEVGLSITTEGDDKYKPPMELKLGAELDFAISQAITPYVGLDLNILLNNPKSHGHQLGETSGDVGVFPYLGATFQMNQTLSLDVNATLGFGKDYLAYTCEGNDKTSITLEAAIIANF